jgi:hypothetical protein
MVANVSVVELILASAAVATVAAVVWRVARRIDARASAREAAANAIARERHDDARAISRLGGTPDRPIPVASAAVIEPRAESLGCLHCEGHTHVTEHGAVRHGAGLIRAVHLTCGGCGRTHTLYFEIELPN